MTQAMSSAGETVLDIWNSIIAEPTKATGVLKLEDNPKDLLIKIIRKAKNNLKIADSTTDEDVIKILGEKLTTAATLAPYRSASLGIATLLGDAGTLGEASSPTDSKTLLEARKVNSIVLQTIAKGWFSKFLLRLHQKLSEHLISSKVLPPKYHSEVKRIYEAVEKAEKSSTQQPELLATIGLYAYSLQEILPALRTAGITTSEQLKEAGALKRLGLWMLKQLNTELPKFTKILSLENRAGMTLTATVSDGELSAHIQELASLEKEIPPFVQKKELPQTMLDRIRIDLAYSLSKNNYPDKKTEIDRLVSLVAKRIPQQFVSDLKENPNKISPTLSQVRKFLEKNAAPFPMYEEAIDILNQLKTGTMKKGSLSRIDKNLLSELIHYATANTRFNDYLREKEPLLSAENLLCSYSYISLHTKEDPTAVFQKVDSTLAATGLTTLSNAYKTLNDQQVYFEFFDKKTQKISYSGSLDKAMKDVIRLCKKKEEKDSLQQQQQQQQQQQHQQHQHQYEALQFPSYQSKWTTIQSEEYQESITSLRKSLESIPEIPKNVKTAATEALEELNKYHEHITFLTKAVSNLKVANPPLTLADMRTIEQYDKLHELDELLPEDLPQQEANLSQNLKKASEICKTFDAYMQILPSFQTGDIVLDDEKLLKEFKASGDKVYSQRKGIPLKEVVREISSKGVFGVQPYFTGSRTHAGIVACFPDDNGTPTLSEVGITEPYTDDPTEMITSLSCVTYQPDFSRIITPVGKDALQKKWGGVNVEARVMSLYRQTLTTFLQTNREKFAENAEGIAGINNDDRKAAEAFIMTLPALVRPSCRQLLPMKQDKQETNAPSQIFTPEEEVTKPELKAFSSQMFCSEFAGAVATVALKETERALMKELVSKPPLFDEKVFMNTEELQTTHPDKLEARIHDFYTAIKTPPKITQLLMGRDKLWEDSPGPLEYNPSLITDLFMKSESPINQENS